MEELIRSLIKFDGARNHDVVKWLQYIEEVFDRLQVQASYNYVALSYFLTSDAAIWFKHNKSSIPDWFTLKRELIKAFPSSSSSRLLDRHQLTVKEELRTLGQEQDILRVRDVHGGATAAATAAAPLPPWWCGSGRYF